MSSKAKQSISSVYPTQYLLVVGKEVRIIVMNAIIFLYKIICWYMLVKVWIHVWESSNYYAIMNYEYLIP